MSDFLHSRIPTHLEHVPNRRRKKVPEGVRRDKRAEEDERNEEETQKKEEEAEDVPELLTNKREQMGKKKTSRPADGKGKYKQACRWG